MKDKKKIPGVVWTLGMVSFFMDMSSEWAFSLLPAFMSVVLGASMTAIGFVEGIAECTALVVKIFSGVFSDLFRKRKMPTLIGYGISALVKPLFAIAGSIGLIMGARFLDRLGKGIRGSPRDALIGDVAPSDIRGACFGLRQALDTWGAALGPLMALITMIIFSGDMRISLWIAAIPAVICVILLAVKVKEPETPYHSLQRIHFHPSLMRRFDRSYWEVVGIGALLSLSHFSDAFLVLKGRDMGISLIYLPSIYILMNVVYGLAAYPAGMLSDKISRRIILAISAVFLFIAHVFLAGFEGLPFLFLGICFWGLFLGFSQGVLVAFVVDAAPEDLKGTAIGICNLAYGLSQFAASVGAGILWDCCSSTVPFWAGAGISATVFLWILLQKK